MSEKENKPMTPQALIYAVMKTNGMSMADIARVAGVKERTILAHSRPRDPDLMPSDFRSDIRRALEGLLVPVAGRKPPAMTQPGLFEDSLFEGGKPSEPAAPPQPPAPQPAPAKSALLVSFVTGEVRPMRGVNFIETESVESPSFSLRVGKRHLATTSVARVKFNGAFGKLPGGVVFETTMSPGVAAARQLMNSTDKSDIDRVASMLSCAVMSGFVSSPAMLPATMAALEAR